MSNSCTNFQYRFYAGGWSSSWRDTSALTGESYLGYAGNANNTYKYVIALKFTTPKFEGTSLNLSFDIPFVRQDATGSSTAKSGTLYFRLFSEDPTTGTWKDAMPTADNCVTSCDWASNDYEVHKVSIEITNNELLPETAYYLTIGSSKMITIGYSSKAGRDFSASLTHAEHGTEPTVAITDNGNNTVTLSGKLGKAGNNNTIESVTLYYTTDGTDPEKSSTRKFYSSTESISSIGTYVGSMSISKTEYAKSISITKACTVRALVECRFTYNTTSDYHSKEIKFYAAPNKPGVPELTYKKSRLTVKEPWTFTWKAATKNEDSATGVSGYYIMLLRKAKGESDFNYITGLTDAGNSYLGQIENAEPDDSYFLRRESSSCTAIIKDPIALGFKAGDEVKLRITAYAWNNYDPKQTLQSDAVDSKDYLVENAGVVNLKVTGKWIEGQVYVKANNKWHEAETVNVKVAGEWQESQ